MRLFKQSVVGTPTGKYFLEAKFVANTGAFVGGVSKNGAFTKAMTLPELEALIGVYAKDPSKTLADMHSIHMQGFCPHCHWNSLDCDCVRAKTPNSEPRATPVDRPQRCECGAHKVNSNIHSYWCPKHENNELVG